MSIVSRLKKFLFVDLRVLKYRWLSDCPNVKGRPKRYYPLLLKGEGSISIGENMQAGVIASTSYYTGYTYIEARLPSSVVAIGNNVAFNNDLSIVAFDRVEIGDFSMVGNRCQIIDSDAHDLAPDRRNGGTPKTAPVIIGKNVLIGPNVIILKGVTIGDNAVIGNGSVVTKSIPADVIAAGNPARVIRTL